MTGGFMVDPDALQRAADASAEAAASAGQVRLGETMELFGAALPGSRAGQSAEVLRSALQTWLAAWCADTETYATVLRAAADRYAASDDRSRVPFGSADRRLPAW